MENQISNKDVVTLMSDETGMTKKDCKAAMDAFIHVIGDAVKAGNKVRLRDLGVFYPHVTQAYETTHPKTRERIIVKGGLTMKFRATAGLRK